MIDGGKVYLIALNYEEFFKEQNRENISFFPSP